MRLGEALTRDIPMRSRFTKTPLVLSLSVAALVLSACAAQNGSQANRAVERLLTVVASATPKAEDATVETPAAAVPGTPTVTLEPTPTPDPPPIFARCITRAALTMHLEPMDDAPVLANLALREVFTVYGRTLNTQWVVGWNASQVYGWVRTQNIGCSVPIVELKPMSARLLVEVAPTPEAVAQAPTQPSPTETPVPTATPIPPTSTPTPVPTPQPEVTPTPTAQPLAGAITPIPLPIIPGAPVPLITVEVPIGPTPLVLVLAVTVVNPEVLQTPTPASTLVVPTPTQAPVELQCRVTSTTAVNIRRQPSRDAERVGVLLTSGEWVARGRNADTSWVFGTSREGVTGWVIASALSCQDAVESLPISAP